MIPLLPNNPPQFPHPSEALDDSNGLLAAGGQLSPEWLLLAYQNGIFPWFGEDDAHIMWWSPAERPVFTPQHVRINRSLRKSLKRYSLPDYKFTINQSFEDVVRACAAPRKHESETWITESMVNAYSHLNQLGFAHSIEMWKLDSDKRQLVGGFYGIQLGAAFFGESMFSKMRDASKVCFVRFCYAFYLAGGQLIDSQVPTEHMENLGSFMMERNNFLRQINTFQKESVCLDTVLMNHSFEKISKILYYDLL